jgi:hypothetical protein
MYVLDNNVLHETTVSSLLIIFGVVLLNTITTLEKKLNLSDGVQNGWYFSALLIGALMFIVGWINIANLTSMGKNDMEATVLYYSSLSIMISAGAMKYMMYTKQIKVPWISLFSMTYVLSWMSLGMLVGGITVNDVYNMLTGNYKMSNVDTNHLLGSMIGPLVIGSTMYALPWQIDNCVVDGPGMPMYVLAWGLLIFLNSNRDNAILDKNKLEKKISPVLNVVDQNVLNTRLDKQRSNKIAQLDFNAS